MTSSAARTETAIDINAPLPAFTECHAGILARLNAAAGLPDMLGAAQRARQLARDLVTMFDEDVYSHHADEENELFPAVLKSAKVGSEQERARSMVAHLVREHRKVEKLFKHLEPGLRSAARGGDAPIDADLLRDLIDTYIAHARYEEQEFLPFAERVLARDTNHMAALGLSLHMRHTRIPVGYI
jgi:hypothetical protein